MLTLKSKYLPFKDGDLVLDLGCGEGRHLTGLLELNEQLTLIGIDINRKDLQHSAQKILDWYNDKKNRTTLIQTSGLQLPFADHSFDHVICSEVLEHIENYQQVLREIERVLKPQGHLCVSVPRCWPEKICWWLSTAYHQVEGGHLRIFSARKLGKEISGLDMQLYKRHWAHVLHSPYWWLKCLFWGKENFLIRAYHKLLVWDLMRKPVLTRLLEKALNPLFGKSVVFYFQKQQGLITKRNQASD